MSWYCKKCETNNEDTDDICVVCNSMPPVLDNINSKIDTTGTKFRLSWRVSNANKVTILYGGAHFDVSRVHSYDLKISEGRQVVFEAENDVATRIFTYTIALSDTETQKLLEIQKCEEQKRKDNLAWATACRWNTEASYLVYLRNYPNGIHSGEVKSRLDKIREERKEADEQSWKRCCLINVSSAYEKYITDFPAGLHIAEAIRRRDECKDYEDWAEATKTNTERSITSYLANHLSGKFAENARLWLKRNKEEEEKWKRAQSYGTIEAYKSYLSRYPNGKYRKQAKELIEKEQDKIRQNCFTAGIVALGLSCIILIPLGIIKCESVNSDYSTPPPPVVYQQQLTPEEINSITTKLDKKIKGLEQAKKDGISRNQTLLNDAQNLLEQLSGTAEYEKYKARLKKVQN